MTIESLFSLFKSLTFLLLFSSCFFFLRYAFGEFDTGIVFTYIGFIYIAKYMVFVESKKFDGIETRNVTVV